MVSLYDGKFSYNYRCKDKVIWNKKIFRKCPFKVNEIKEIDEIRTGFIGIRGINQQWWNWWELEPVSVFKKPLYWIKFYHWYYTRFKKL